MSRTWLLRISIATLVAAGLVGTATVAGATANSDHIWAGEKLVAGAYQTSTNGEYRLIQQADGNLVEYKRKNGKYSEALWSTGTARNPGATTFLQKDGNLVVRAKNDAKSPAIWSSNTATPKVSHLTVQNDGNVVVYTKSGEAIWASKGLNKSLPGGPGPQKFDQGAAATAALRELGTTRRTGYDKPGECMVSVRRWIQAAGGTMAGGGVMQTYRNSPAKLVATGNGQVVGNAGRGDVIQYVNNASPESFANGVHTVMVVANNGDGTLHIVQSNGNWDGKVTEVKRWTPRTPSAFTAHLWRFGR